DALFAVGGDVYGWDDVVALAKRRGDWDELAAQVRAGLAALAELEARGEPLADEEIDESARQFRYERNLLAADELDAWLDRHRLTAADWRDSVARALARDRSPGADASLPEDEVAAAVWAEGVCSGRLEQLAAELARLAAVSPGAPPGELDAAFEQFCADAVDEATEARELEANGLEW